MVLNEPPATVRIHAAKEFELCEKCQLIEDLNRDYYLLIFESCSVCKLKFLNEASISEVFFVARQWQPNVQKNMKLFINLLLNKNCGVNDRDGVTDMTMLMYTCRSGAAFIGDDEHVVSVLKTLVDKGADLNAKSIWLQMNCLHLCAFYDSHKCLEFLLNENCCVGINTPCESFNYGSALHISCLNKCFKSAHVLIKHGANIDELDQLGHKPIEYLVKSEKKHTAGVFPQDHIENYLFENGNLSSDKMPDSSIPADLIKLNVTLKVSDDAKKELAKMKIKLNDHVIVSNKKIGHLRYCGPTKFANGTWAGVELVKPQGKHDGSLAGIRYFNCPKNHGIFCQLDKLRKFEPVKTQIPTIRYFTTSKIELPDNEIKLKRSHSHHSSAAHTLQPVKIPPNAPNKISTPTSQSAILAPPSFNESKNNANLGEGSTSSIDGHFDEDNLQTGMKVMYQGHRAIVRYIGKTHFAEGVWIGLELISQSGKNDGSIQGIKYFECDKRHGIFVRPNKLITNKFRK